MIRQCREPKKRWRDNAEIVAAWLALVICPLLILTVVVLDGLGVFR